MNTNKLITLGKSFAVAILVLGVIHDVATYTPMIKGSLTCLPHGGLKAMIYMSLICGSSFILNGIILILLLNKVRQFPFLNPVMIVIGSFLAVSGILSIVYMFDNPFAWLTLFLNLGMFFIIIGLQIKLNKKLRI
jgi:hypothetical protein